MDVEARLASGVPLPPCTSSTRRVDIGGLPPRVPVAVDLPLTPSPAFALSRARLAKLARRTATHDPVARRRALDRIRRALASGAALKAVLGPDETELRQQAEAMDRTDPRLEWLLTQAQRWRRANEKTLVFVAHRETLEMLRDALSARAQLASGVFHEELSAARRDTEVARFRADDGPSILVSTEAGGEGRNFEFCHRLVLYDLPWKPSDGGAAHRAAGSHRPPHPGRNRLFPSGVGHRRRRRAAVRAARALPRADGRRRAAARPRRERAGGDRARSGRVAVRCADRAAHRRRAGGAHADPRGGVSAAASRSLSRRAGTVDSRPRPGGPRRADGTGRRQRGLAARLSRRAGARPARLRHRVRQRGAHRQPARRPGRVVVRRLVRSRVRGRGREHRLLRLGPPARRRTAGALRGGSEGARRAARGARSPASAAPGSSPSTRMVRSSRSSPSTRTAARGRTGPRRSAAGRSVR